MNFKNALRSSIMKPFILSNKFLKKHAYTNSILGVWESVSEYIVGTSYGKHFNELNVFDTTTKSLYEFFEDGTCIIKMFYESNDFKLEPLYCTYQIANNKLIIHQFTNNQDEFNIYNVEFINENLNLIKKLRSEVTDEISTIKFRIVN